MLNVQDGKLLVKNDALQTDCGCCTNGACCNGTTCVVKPQSQCNAAAGEVFKGVGTVCSPNPCSGPCSCQFRTASGGVTLGGNCELASMTVSVEWFLTGRTNLPLTFTGQQDFEISEFNRWFDSRVLTVELGRQLEVWSRVFIQNGQCRISASLQLLADATGDRRICASEMVVGISAIAALPFFVTDGGQCCPAVPALPIENPQPNCPGSYIRISDVLLNFANPLP